jgi:hypothetical protein
MRSCVRPGCGGESLAPWWALCTACTAPLLTSTDSGAGAVRDQQLAAGWDAVHWAERIAPSRWGHASDDDAWVLSIRCLTLASVVTGRAQGCGHTSSSASTVPVVVVLRAPGYLYCPVCAEPVVASVTIDDHPCARCRRVTVSASDRLAALAGASLIVVGQLCDGCAATVLDLGMSTAREATP